MMTRAVAAYLLTEHGMESFQMCRAPDFSLLSYLKMKIEPMNYIASNSNSRLPTPTHQAFVAPEPNPYHVQ